MPSSSARQARELGARRLGRHPARGQQGVAAARRQPSSRATSGAPTASTTSPSARSSAATCSAVPGSKKSALSRIGGSAVRTSSSTASWRAPCMGTTPQ